MSIASENIYLIITWSMSPSLLPVLKKSKEVPSKIFYYLENSTNIKHLLLLTILLNTHIVIPPKLTALLLLTCSIVIWRLFLLKTSNWWFPICTYNILYFGFSNWFQNSIYLFGVGIKLSVHSFIYVQWI